MLYLGTILSFFNRGAAIQMPRGHIGADLLLPIRRKSVDGQSRVVYSYFYLLVLIKNDKRNVCTYIVKNCAKMLHRTFEEGTSRVRCNIGYSIIMNDGQEREESYCMGKLQLSIHSQMGKSEHAL
jgi:hypothetical protein